MNGARPSGADVTPDTRWMTYQEIADRLGTDAESARRRAEREGWPCLPGNDGQERVGVPGDAVGLGNTPDRADEGGDDRAGALAALREALVREQDRADRAEAAAASLPELRDRAARAEGERDALREALLAAQAAAEDAGRRARAAEEQAAAAHRRAAEIAAVLGRVAEGLERFQKTQATTAEAAATARAERAAALARAEEAALRAGEEQARAAEANRRAEAAEARLDELQRLPAGATAPQPAELEATQTRAVDAERQAAEARRRADEAERRAAVANERLDRFQRERIARAQAEAERQGREAAERELAGGTAVGSLARAWKALVHRWR
jgi:DNA repair exonuclease SbcCD ATPase subunit